MTGTAGPEMLRWLFRARLGADVACALRSNQWGDHILHMSDALSEGIVKQFPEKFGKGVTATTGR